MKYSYNLDRGNLVFAQRYEINASYKDMGAVCDSVRYMKASDALVVLDRLISMERPIPFRRHNKRMGSRHELGGKKGAYPIKAGKEVRKVVVDAIANANNKGYDGSEMYIVHACANKTHIESRQPSKGSLAWGRGMYGRSALMHSDLEYGRIEIALAGSDEKVLTKNMKYFINKKGREFRAFVKGKKDAQKQRAAPQKAKAEKKAEPKKEEKKKDAGSNDTAGTSII